MCGTGLQYPPPMKPKALDVAAVVLSLAVVAAFALRGWTARGESSTVVVQAAAGRYLYPMDQDRVERIPGPRGDTILVIRERAAWIADSPCPDKVCVAAGHIARTGEWIACLPNRVMVSIGGTGGPATDATVF